LYKRFPSLESTYGQTDMFFEDFCSNSTLYQLTRHIPRPKMYRIQVENCWYMNSEVCEGSLYSENLFYMLGSRAGSCVASAH